MPAMSGAYARRSCLSTSATAAVVATDDDAAADDDAVGRGRGSAASIEGRVMRSELALAAAPRAAAPARVAGAPKGWQPHRTER